MLPRCTPTTWDGLEVRLLHNYGHFVGTNVLQIITCGPTVYPVHYQSAQWAQIGYL